MAANRKIRVGIVGANRSRGFASIAHISQPCRHFRISRSALSVLRGKILQKQRQGHCQVNLW
jgi:hypothetical protein